MRVLVVGGERPNGIGAACIRRIEKEGHVVDTSFDLGYDAIHTTTEGLERRLRSLRCDAVVWCVGMNHLEWAKDVERLQMTEVMQVNTFALVEFVGAWMRVVDKAPNIVVISSDAARNAMRTSISYCMSKAALDMAVKVLARELGNRGRINAVAPAMVEGTDMTQYIDRTVPKIRGWSPNKAAEYEKTQLPLGRRMSTDEVASVVWGVLIGPPMQTGSIVDVTGGK